MLAPWRIDWLSLLMATCRLCGADVAFFPGPDGKNLAVDAHEVMSGEDRFVLKNGRLEPITPTSNVAAFKAHRSTCPYKTSGERR